MILLHFPPSLVDRGHPLVVEGQVATGQMQNTLASVLVLEDLLERKQRETHLLQVDLDGGVRSNLQRSDSLIDSTLFVFQTESHLAVAFERHDELFFQLLLYVAHVLGGRVPDIREDVAELEAVAPAS